MTDLYVRVDWTQVKKPDPRCPDVGRVLDSTNGAVFAEFRLGYGSSVCIKVPKRACVVTADPAEVN